MNGRLEVLLRWLGEASPDVVCLQELKAPQEKSRMKAIEAEGYGAVWQGQKSWNDVASKAPPGEPEDEHSRYIEAIVDGIVIGGLYLPNGNPHPGPKFDYKLRWMKRLHGYGTASEFPHDAGTDRNPRVKKQGSPRHVRGGKTAPRSEDRTSASRPARGGTATLSAFFHRFWPQRRPFAFYQKCSKILGTEGQSKPG